MLPADWPGQRAPLLALNQPFLWVETTGTARSIVAIFMPSPPSIYLRSGAVKTPMPVSASRLSLVGSGS
jgi:hypothetical protein